MFTAKLPQSNKVSQKLFSLSEINTSTFRGYMFKPRGNSKQSSKRELGNIQKQGLHFIRLNINSLLPKIDEQREIVKISNPTVIGITETKLDNLFGDSDISIDADTVPFDVIETEKVEV